MKLVSPELSTPVMGDYKATKWQIIELFDHNNENDRTYFSQFNRNIICSYNLKKSKVFI